MFQRLADTRKEGRIVVGLAGADGVGLVMQMFAFQPGIDSPLVGAIQAQIKYLGREVIDSDDGVIANSHGFSLWFE